jgi:hypothetical protein
MRWTLGCSARMSRRRKHSRGRPSRVVLISRRWDQACGRRIRRRWRLSSPALQGEREAAVKTIARGMPVVPAEPVVTAACYFCCRRAMGAACTRHSLRPLPSRATHEASLGRERAAGMRSHILSAVMPRLACPPKTWRRRDRGIQYAAASRLLPHRLWNTGSPGRSRAMTPKLCLAAERRRISLHSCELR